MDKTTKENIQKRFESTSAIFRKLCILYKEQSKYDKEKEVQKDGN